MDLCGLPSRAPVSFGTALSAAAAGYLLWQLCKACPLSCIFSFKTPAILLYLLWLIYLHLQVARFVALFIRAHRLLAAQPNLPVVYDQFNPFDGKARSFTAAQPQRLGIADSRALGGIQRIQIGPCFNVRPVPEHILCTPTQCLRQLERHKVSKKAALSPGRMAPPGAADKRPVAGRRDAGQAELPARARQAHQLPLQLLPGL